MNPSKNFTYEEVVSTEHREYVAANIAWANANWKHVMLQAALLEQVRSFLGVPMRVNSWVRCPPLNHAVGGVPDSDHLVDEIKVGATDFTASTYGSPYDVARAIAGAGIPFRQLIYEYTWVHISSPRIGETPRNQVLTLMPDRTYAAGIILRG